MKIRSVEVLEKELKQFLSNPETTNNLTNAVSKAKEILEIKKDSSFANYALALNDVVNEKSKKSGADFSKSIENFENIIKIDLIFLKHI